MYSSPGKYEHGFIQEKKDKVPKYAAGGDLDRVQKRKKAKQQSSKLTEIAGVIVTFILIIIISTILKHLI